MTTIAEQNGHSPVWRQAHDLIANGFSVVPVKPDGSKASLGGWKELQTRQLSHDEVDERFAGDCGIAIMGGYAQNETIDIDRPDLVQPFIEAVNSECPGLIARLCHIQTPRADDHGNHGAHFHYCCFEIETGQHLAESPPDDETGRTKAWIETRGDGNYAIIPPSPGACHPTGRTYEHIAGPPLTDLQEITPAERAVLFRCARSFNQNIHDIDHDTPAHISNGRLSPGDDFNQRASWDDILPDWPVVHRQGDIEYRRRPGKTDPGWSATTGLVSKAGNSLLCVFSSNASPFTGPSNGKPHTTYTKFAAYATLHHGGDFSAAAAELRQRGYGQDDSLLTTNGQAAGSTAAPAADEIVRWEISPPDRNGRRLVVAHDVAGEVLTRHRFSPEDLNQRERLFKALDSNAGPKSLRKLESSLFSAVATADAEVSNECDYQVMTVAELAKATIKHDWIIPDALVRYQNLVIGGVLKTCKTKFSCALALSVAAGVDFMGKPVRQQLPVLFMSGESGLATLKQNFHTIAEAHDIDLDGIEGLYVTDRLLRANSDPHIDAFRRIAENYRGGVWMLDPWYLISGLSAGESAANSAAGDRLEVLNSLAREFELTPVLVAHCRKPGKRTAEEKKLLSQPGDLSDLSGAGVAEWARAWLIITRKTEYENNGHHDLWVRLGTSAGTSEVLHVMLDEGHFVAGENPRWSVDVESHSDAIESAQAEVDKARQAKAEERLLADKRSIMQALAKLERGIQARVLERTSMNGSRFKAAWIAGLESGEIVEDGEMPANNKHMKPAFRLATEEEIESTCPSVPTCPNVSRDR